MPALRPATAASSDMLPLLNERCIHTVLDPQVLQSAMTSAAAPGAVAMTTASTPPGDRR